jgi:hypothetical protein
MDNLRVLYNNEARTYLFNPNAPRVLNFDVNYALSVIGKNGNNNKSKHSSAPGHY